MDQSENYCAIVFWPLHSLDRSLRFGSQRSLACQTCSIRRCSESISDTFDFSQTPEANEDDSYEEKIEALAKLICCASDQSSAALFVLMGTLENSVHPK